MKTRLSTLLKQETAKTSPYFKEERVKTIKQETKLENSPQGVPDNVDTDLKVLFVGINPGLTSAARGHHYAGPTNHFWPCLSESGLVDRKVTFTDDVDLPALYRLGFTNLTARASRRQTDLSLAEQKEGIPTLNHKFETLHPRVACFVGKGIYEIYSGKKCDTMGLQPKEYNIKWLSADGEKGETVMFVMPSTSGIVTAYQKPDKIKFFQELCTIAQQQDKMYPRLRTVKLED
ncbi:G/T mismatch-specific thymine DNA glycosylase-like [Mucor ambiguus]|uniref:G/T mismatch-specific thymine DNA glycosylase n=1 Tax=Mucor ambiguus TaxID=91626 RepID=A0A0C9LSB8_9FUNG|nr:G/T mismatch-specific thymine DNA glycosylase-like [Mucor ambiguus]